jgi:hypothetical protein
MQLTWLKNLIRNLKPTSSVLSCFVRVKPFTQMNLPRDQLTVKILDELPTDNKVSLKFAKTIWWQNPTRFGGYRLSDQGFDVFAKQLDLKYWTLSLPPVTINLCKELDSKIPSPFYVDVKRRELMMFGSKEAMMASLHGDILRWLSTLKKRS